MNLKDQLNILPKECNIPQILSILANPIKMRLYLNIIHKYQWVTPNGTSMHWRYPN